MVLNKLNYYLSSLIVLLFLNSAHSQENGMYEIVTDTSFETRDLDFIDDYIEGKNIILTGENHRFYGSNQLIKLKFLLYLYEKGFRNYVLEFGSGIGYLFNEYAVHNNKEAYTILEKSFGKGYMPYKYFLNVIKEFNQEKPLEDRIQIHGADYTRYPFFSLKAMALIIDQMGCQNELKEYYEDLNVVSSGKSNMDDVGFFVRRTPENFNLKAGFKTYNNRIFELSIRNLIQDFERDTLKFQLALGPKFDQFNQLVSDLKETLEWHKGEGIRIQSHIQRERYMTRNIARIIQQDSTNKVYGQFGRCHVRGDNFTQECYGFDLSSISQRLEKIDTSLFSVKSIPIFYAEERILESNKEVTGMRTSKLLPLAKIFFYDTEKNAIQFTKEDLFISDLVIINTFSSDADLEDVLVARNVKCPSRLAYYSGADTEDVFSLLGSYSSFNINFNESFGVDFYGPNHFSYGFDLRSINNDGGQSLFRFSMVHPMNFTSDSLDLRFTNYRFQFGAGYNFIHNKLFSLYSDMSLFFGFAKIRERRPALEQLHTFNVKTEQVNYRNPYIGGALAVGARIKFGAASLFLESAYQRDFSNHNWRVNGADVSGIYQMSLSNFIFFSGISFAF